MAGHGAMTLTNWDQAAPLFRTYKSREEARSGKASMLSLCCRQAVRMSGATRLSLSQQPPQAKVKHLIRQFDPHCASHPPGQLPPAKWMDVPFDIMREVVQRLAVHDVQTTLLVCREWHDGFSNGVVSLKPRLLKLEELAYRLDTSPRAYFAWKLLKHGSSMTGPYASGVLFRQ